MNVIKWESYLGWIIFFNEKFNCISRLYDLVILDNEKILVDGWIFYIFMFLWMFYKKLLINFF